MKIIILVLIFLLNIFSFIGILDNRIQTFTPLEKATNFSWWYRVSRGDGGLMPPSLIACPVRYFLSNGVKEFIRNSLTGFTQCQDEIIRIIREQINVGEQLLEAYQEVVGKEVIDDLRELARSLKGKRVLHINTTRKIGGVAGMLEREIPFLNALDIDTEWFVIEGNDYYFDVVKTLFNGLQGEKVTVDAGMLEVLEDTCRENIERINPSQYDVIIIHDAGPLPMAKFLKEKAESMGDKAPKIIWRSHMDTSIPNLAVWNFLKGYVEQVEHIVATLKEYLDGLPGIFPDDKNTSIIYPFIDPLDDYNIALSNEEIRQTLEKYEIDPNKRIITLASRFDRFKGQQDFIKAFEELKTKPGTEDVVAVLVGGFSIDDPEAAKEVELLREMTEDIPDIYIIVNVTDKEFNAFQRTAQIVVQPSLKEGFGLTVTQAMWKAKPVIASDVGGIPKQILINPETGIPTGFLIPPGELGGENREKINALKNHILELLDRPELATEIGRSAKNFVIKNFLITRIIRDWLELFNQELNP